MDEQKVYRPETADNAFAPSRLPLSRTASQRAVEGSGAVTVDLLRRIQAVALASQRALDVAQRTQERLTRARWFAFEVASVAFVAGLLLGRFL